MQKISFEISLPLPEIVKDQTTSLTYDVTDHIYSKSKSVQLRTNLVNHEVGRILTWN